jgi:hypothetical protein
MERKSKQIQNSHQSMLRKLLIEFGNILVKILCGKKFKTASFSLQTSMNLTHLVTPQTQKPYALLAK